MKSEGAPHYSSWLARMESEGVAPNDVTFKTLVFAEARAGRPEAAAEWLAQMEARGFEVSVATHTAIVDAWAKGGNVRRAEECLEALQARGVHLNDVSFLVVI